MYAYAYAYIYIYIAYAYIYIYIYIYTHTHIGELQKGSNTFTKDTKAGFLLQRGLP